MSPQPVATYLPNRWGLFDVYGNCAEPVLTSFDMDYGPDSYITEPDGMLASPEHRFFVRRGGKYVQDPQDWRSAFRGVVGWLVSESGFRLARTICAQAPADAAGSSRLSDGFAAAGTSARSRGNN
jgi:formylglycine-generating enzyme required for sulfatase activity